jgi:hypothetical protein
MFHSYWETQLDGSCGRGGQTLARVSYTDRAEQKHAGNGLQLTLRFSFQPHLTPGEMSQEENLLYSLWVLTRVLPISGCLLEL